MQISFDMLSLFLPRFMPRATVETDQSVRPERIGDEEKMTAGTKMLFGGDDSHSRRKPGGGPLEKLIVIRETSGSRESVTASAGNSGGAVTLLCSLIPSILSGFGDPFRPANVKF
jgi:hypothetical protein